MWGRVDSPSLDGQREHALEGGELTVDAGVRYPRLLPLGDVRPHTVGGDVHGPIQREGAAQVTHG